MIKLKRVYDALEKGDGFRILVDRLWPRGVSKERVKVDIWLKDIAPSTALRKRFGHDPGKWDEFKASYRKELREKNDLLSQIKSLEKEHKTITLVYSARNTKHNQAVVLKGFLS